MLPCIVSSMPISSPSRKTRATMRKIHVYIIGIVLLGVSQEHVRQSVPRGAPSAQAA